MNSKIIFIINPVAGKRTRKNIPDLIRKTFEDGYDIEIVYTKSQGDATKIARRYLNKGFLKLVAVGGDGTVNEVASAMVQTDAILGILPLGSGNGLARHLKIPMRLPKALNLIKEGNHKKIDYGEINNRKFFCTTGIGFDAHIGNVFSKMEGRGFSNYVKATVSEFRRYRAKRYEISMNDTTIVRDAFLITFANASQYGNNAHIAPKADIQDGKLEVAIMRSFPLITAPGVGARLFLKNMDKSNYIETYQSDDIIVKCKSPDVIHYDGEPDQMDKILHIKINPDGLNVFSN